MLARTTTVLTSSGPVEAGALRGGEELMTWTLPDGLRPSPMTGYLVERSHGPLVTMTTANGSLGLSPDHPVFVASSPPPGDVDVLLVERQGRGAALGLLRGNPAGRGTDSFHYRSTTTEAGSATERFWVIERHADPRQASFRCHLLACRHALPVVELAPGWPGLDRRDLERLFDEEDTLPRAAALRRATLLLDRHPHLTVRLLDPLARSRRLLADLQLFRTPEGHALALHPLAEAASTGRGGLVPAAGQTSLHRRFADAEAAMAPLMGGEHVDVQIRAVLGDTTYRLMPACHVRVGMLLPSIRGDGVASVPVTATEAQPSRALTYRMGPADHPTLVAGGVVVAATPWPLTPTA